MKTITIQGTEEDFKNLTFLQQLTKNSLPKVSETRVYVVDTFNIKKRSWKDLTDEEFISLVEEEGNIYTLGGFQEAFNAQDISTEIDVIRFINVII